MKEQIEEMNEIIASKICEAYSPMCDEWQPHNCGKCYANGTHINEISEALYNAGYRKQEWISIEDRLPERKGRYLVYIPNEQLICCVYYDCDASVYGDNGVTHWMPLPQPPKMKGGAE